MVKFSDIFKTQAEREAEIEAVRVAKPEPRIFYIPKEDIPRILELFEKEQTSDTALARYHLWMALAELFPEVQTGNWTFNAGDIFRPYVKERL